MVASGLDGLLAHCSTTCCGRGWGSGGREGGGEWKEGGGEEGMEGGGLGSGGREGGREGWKEAITCNGRERAMYLQIWYAILSPLMEISWLVLKNMSRLVMSPYFSQGGIVL